MNATAQTFFRPLTALMVVVGCVFMHHPVVTAASFAEVMVRPERVSAGVHPGNILVQVKVDQVATEDTLRLRLGSAWLGSVTASEYTVTTSSLPTGVTAWPGIGTATSVSGQEVMFPSGDLSPGVLYGFYLTGGIPSNPSVAGSAPTYSWGLATMEGGSPSSESDSAISIIPSDQVTVTGSILPPVGDYDVLLQTDDGGSTLPQHHTITYTITYGSSYHSATPLTLQTTWPLGLVDGNVIPSVELLEYVPGSATNAYGASAPVLDLVARTITWTIPSFPAMTTGQVVSFQLKTTDTYTRQNQVTGSVTARITQPITTVDAQVPIRYKYAGQSSTPSTTTTQTPSSSSSNQPGAITSPVHFVSYRLESITSFDATFTVALTDPSAVTTRYGLRPDALSSQLESSSGMYHTIRLKNLLPNQEYYVRFYLDSGAQSELVRIKTATAGELPAVANIHLASDNSLYWAGMPNTQDRLLFPTTFPLEVALRLHHDAFVQSVVLYAETQSGAREYVTSLQRGEVGLWSGRGISTNQPGATKYIALLLTTTGLRIHLDVFTLDQAMQLRVVDRSTDQPIERARIDVYLRDPILKVFQWASAPEFLAENPLYTTAGGLLPLVLKPGEYRILVSALGYQPQTIHFSLLKNETFPLILMDRQGNYIISAVQYHIGTAKLKLAQYFGIFEADARSQAVIQLVTWWTLLVSTPITIVLLLASSKFSLLNTWRTSALRANPFFRKIDRTKSFLHGVVISATDARPLSDVLIIFEDVDGKTQHVVHTPRSGRFVVPKQYLQEGYAAQIFAQGYVQTELPLSSLEDGFEVKLSPDETGTTQKRLVMILGYLARNLFLINLLCSVLLGVFFAVLHGNQAALPFLAVSIFNLFIFLAAIF